MARQQVDSTFKVVSSNIKATPPMRPSKVLSDMREVRRHADVVGFSEINYKYYWKCLRQVFPQNEWRKYPTGLLKTGGRHPIVWKRDRFELISYKTTLLHGPVRYVCRSRHINTVLLRDRVTNEMFTVNNMHFTPGAHNRKRFEVNEKGRKLAWIQGSINLRNWCASQLFPVINLGDYNHPGPAPFGSRLGKRVITYFNDKGPDFMFTLTGKYIRIDLEYFFKIKGSLNTDHPILVGKVKLVNYTWPD